MLTAQAVHVDTIRLSRAYNKEQLPDVATLREMGFQVSVKSNDKGGVIVRAVHQPLSRLSHEPRITITRSDVGYSGVEVEGSVAKLLDGGGLSAQSDDDLDAALTAIEDLVRSRVGVEFDVRAAVVKRLDANADFAVGEAGIAAYVSALSCSGRLKRAMFGDTTACFYNSSRKLMVYGKRAETLERCRSGKASLSDVQAASGLLRLESSLKRPEAVRRLAMKLGVEPNAGSLVTLGTARFLVSEALSELRMDEPRVSAAERDALLVKRFGPEAASLAGVLDWRARNGTNFWKGLGWSAAKYYRVQKRLRDAGLWDTSSEGLLPALSLAA